MKAYELHTNIVYNGRVGYRHSKVEQALKNGQDIVCYTDDRPGEFMTVPNFLIKRRIIYSKVVGDKTGARVLLDYFWWKSDQEISKAKVDKKQLKLIN